MSQELTKETLLKPVLFNRFIKSYGRNDFSYIQEILSYISDAKNEDQPHIEHLNVLSLFTQLLENGKKHLNSHIALSLIKFNFEEPYLKNQTHKKANKILLKKLNLLPLLTNKADAQEYFIQYLKKNSTQTFSLSQTTDFIREWKKHYKTIEPIAPYFSSFLKDAPIFSPKEITLYSLEINFPAILSTNHHLKLQTLLQILRGNIKSISKEYPEFIKSDFNTNSDTTSASILVDSKQKLLILETYLSQVISNRIISFNPKLFETIRLENLISTDVKKQQNKSKKI